MPGLSTEEAISTLDQNILTSMRVTRLYRMTYWNGCLEEHRRHATFRVHTWPYTREYGFTCSCSGIEQEWRIDVGAMKEMLPDTRQIVLRMFRNAANRGMKKIRRAHHQASVKARALLHKFLTSSQRRELRKLRCFTMPGLDGRQYLVTEGTSSNVEVEHLGRVYRLCCIPKAYKLPTFDILLAQKVMLETEPEIFLRTARVIDTVTHEIFESGQFIVDGVEPQRTRSRDVVYEGHTNDYICDNDLLTLEQSVLDDPSEWVQAQLNNASPQEVGVVIPQEHEVEVERIETRHV